MIRLEFLYRLTPDWQDLGRPSAGQWDMDTKKGREKFLLCLIDSSSKLFAPSFFASMSHCPVEGRPRSCQSEVRR